MEKKINKRFYFVLFLVLSISTLLLGLSYARESSESEKPDLNEIYDESLRVVMSDEFSNVVFTDSFERDISIINRGNTNVSYAIKVISDKLDVLSYSLDSKEKTNIENNIIYINDLDKLGTDNDHVTHNLTIYNNSEDEVSVSLSVIKYEELLIDKIKHDDNVYVDSEENYRYYGVEVNNYVKYDNNLYRIVGIINNKIKIVDVNAKDGSYDSNDSYLTIYDYLRSFNNDKVTTNNTANYDSWLNDISTYWLADTYGDYNAYYVNNKKVSFTKKTDKVRVRTTKELYMDYKVVLGDGSKNNPYEVVYEG